MGFRGEPRFSRGEPRWTRRRRPFPPLAGWERAPSGELLGAVGRGRGRVALAEPLLEAGHAAAGVEDALLARVERVAGRARLDGELTVRRGAAGGERVPAATGHRGGVVVGVDSGLHTCRCLFAY